MRMILIDVKNAEVGQVHINDIEDYYKLLECRCFDIVERGIAGKRYDIICDDEALMVEGARPSAITKDHEVMLYGNLLVTGEATDEGKETELTAEDIDHIMQHIGGYVEPDEDGNMRLNKLLMDVEY